MNNIEILPEEIDQSLLPEDCKTGKIYKCIKGASNIGAILIKTSNRDWSFINLSTGECWGPNLKYYRFEEVKNPIKIIPND